MTSGTKWLTITLGIVTGRFIRMVFALISRLDVRIVVNVVALFANTVGLVQAVLGLNSERIWQVFEPSESWLRNLTCWFQDWTASFGS